MRFLLNLDSGKDCYLLTEVPGVAIAVALIAERHAKVEKRIVKGDRRKVT